MSNRSRWRGALSHVPDALVQVGFAGLFVATVFLGRLTRPAGAPLAVVWPAAAVACLWLAWASRRRLAVVTVVAITALSTAINLATGAPPIAATLMGAGGAAQAAVTCALLRRAHGPGDTPRLRTVGDLSTLLTASYVGAAASAVIGFGAVNQSLDPVVVLTILAWLMRVGTSAFVIIAAVLLVTDPQQPARLAARRRREPVVLALLSAAAYVFVFTSPVQLPLAFAVVPLSVWIALRFSTTAAALHVVAVGAFVVTTTLAHRGPFGTAPVAVATTLLTQSFITVIGVLTLVMALHRDERVQLLTQLRAAHLRAEQQAQTADQQARLAGEQTQLLSTVLAEMDEGIALIDADGRFLVRNPAATRLMSTYSPDGRVRSAESYGLHNPDGTPCTREQMADARALAGDRVDQDFLLRLADDTQRVLATRAAPLITPEGERRALIMFADATSARRAAAEVTEARDLFGSVLDAATDLAIISTDMAARITVFNVGAEQLLGYRASEVLGRPVWFLQDRAELAERLTGRDVDVDVLCRGGVDLDPRVVRFITRQTLGTRRTALRHSSGRTVPVMMTMSLMHDAAGTVIGAMSASRDLSAELAAKAELDDSEERFQQAFDNAPMGMMMVGLQPGAEGDILRVNPALTQLLGYGELDLLTMNVTELSHPGDLEVTHTMLGEHASGATAHTRTEKRYLHADGSTVWIRLSTSVIHPHDWPPYSLALIEDVTARKKAEQALTHQALHDPLTGLPNRSLFADRLDHALAAAVRSSNHVGVLYLDLDGFKQVNDTAGHAAGDELLRHVAQRISGCLRPGDTLARLGGDEFAIVCPDVDHDTDAAPVGVANLRTVAERILAVMQAPVQLTAGSFAVTVSIGLALADATTSVGDVMQAADAAMYAAKHAGKNRVVAHGSPEHTSSATTDTSESRLLAELSEGLCAGEIVMHGQPVLDLLTGQVVAVETLVRWQHPRRGLLSPAHFLPAAESSALMVPLGRRVLDESCRMAASWAQLLDRTAPHVHVNVSARQFEDPQLVDDTLAALARHDLPGHRLVLELTETHMPRITPQLIASLRQLREHGVRIAIDDLGTGYSGLARLTELPIDILKIDLSFIAGLGVDPRCDAVVRAILGIGTALGLSVVAEGVETPAQAELLRRYGCDTVQGYLYSPPRPEASLLTDLCAHPSLVGSGL